MLSFNIVLTGNMIHGIIWTVNRIMKKNFRAGCKSLPAVQPASRKA